MRFWKTLISCVAMAVVSSAADALDQTIPCVPACSGSYTPYTGNMTALPSFAQLVITNNFASKTEYFGSNVPDENIWLYFLKNGASTAATYYQTACADNTPPISQKMVDMGYVNLSRVWNRTVYLPPSSVNKGSRLYAVISKDCPTSAPGGNALVYNCTQPSSGSSTLAWQLYEWNFFTDQENNDLSFVDQFSFPCRLTMKEDSKVTYQAGFAAEVLSSVYLVPLS